MRAWSLSIERETTESIVIDYKNNDDHNIIVVNGRPRWSDRTLEISIFACTSVAKCRGVVWAQLYNISGIHTYTHYTAREMNSSFFLKGKKKSYSSSSSSVYRMCMRGHNNNNNIFAW